MVIKTFTKPFKAIAFAAALSMLAVPLAACGSSAESGKGRVYFLNSKAEQMKQWEQLGRDFSKRTGIPVTIKTATAGSYDETLKSELAKSKAPTLFNIGDMNSFYNWTHYYANMSNTAMYRDLLNKSYALRYHGQVDAVPYVMERYGIIYNKALLNKYFAARWSTIKSINKLDDFAALKTVADQIQDHKQDLGVEGAFTSAGFDQSSDWRFKNQLAEIPIYYEYRDRKITKTPPSLKGTYVKNFKNIFDLYLKDETVPRTTLSAKTGDEAAAEFALGKAVFYQNGSWAYSQIKGQKVKDSQIGVLPIYLGVKGEKKAGLTVSFNYFCMNRQVSPQDQKATRQFLEWVLKSRTARTSLTRDMGFETPFASYQKAGFVTTNPILRANDAYQRKGCYDIVIYPLPSQQWGDSLGNAMLAYAQGTGKWDAVRSAFISGWASEYKNAGLASKLG